MGRLLDLCPSHRPEHPGMRELRHALQPVTIMGASLPVFARLCVSFVSAGRQSRQPAPDVPVRSSRTASAESDRARRSAIERWSRGRLRKDAQARAPGAASALVLSAFCPIRFDHSVGCVREKKEPRRDRMAGTGRRGETIVVGSCPARPRGAERRVTDGVNKSRS
jgi:hypothetical protein